MAADERPRGRWTIDDFCDNGMRDYPVGAKLLIWFVVIVLLAFSKLMWRWRMDGAERLKPAPGRKTGSVIICNHTSMAEVVAIYVHIWLSGRRCRPIAKSEFFDNGLVAWCFARAGAIPVDRGQADMAALRRAQRALKRGEDVLIFPEGTRIRTDDQPVTVHGGYALMAQMAKAPIAPMAVCGFRDITRPGSHLMRPVTCWMRAGDAFSLEDAPAGMKRRERLAWAEAEGMRRVYEIRDGLRREHPGRR